MMNSYRIIPVYTGDVSGAASALYEMGGLVVIHDPSGCNSTYNTHDETRWYDRDSLIYISGLSERDAILGNDEKLIQDTVYAAEKMRPQFIAFTSSPVPFLSGTDFAGIARVTEKRTGIPSFYVPANGTHDYSVGAGEAFLAVAKMLFEHKTGKEYTEKENTERENAGTGSAEKIRINLLGVTPLDFDAEGAVRDLREKLSEFEVLSCWAMECSLSDLAEADKADVNVVTSVTGLQAARYMEKRFGIPYVIGCPVGAFTFFLKDRIRRAACGRDCGISEKAGAERSSQDHTFLIGEPVMMLSLAEHLHMSQGLNPVVINPLETSCPGVPICTSGEEDLEDLLKEAETVWCDPLYKPILPRTAKCIEISHEAFSGRCFRRSRVNLLSL